MTEEIPRNIKGLLGKFDLYCLYSAQADKYYIGISQKVFKRVSKHIGRGGSKATDGYNDWKPVYYLFLDAPYYDAAKVESFFKKYQVHDLGAVCKIPINNIIRLPDTEFQAKVRYYRADEDP